MARSAPAQTTSARASGGRTPLVNTASASAQAIIFGLRIWAAVCLALYVAFWLQLDHAYWAAASAAAVSQPSLGASFRKGWYRMIGTIAGAIFIVMLTVCFVQNRVAFLLGLTLWGAACTLVATLLRNFAAYAASLAGFTAVIVASDELGATGGADGTVLMYAITRSTEICIGIACAGLILAATDFGGAQRRLTTLLAELVEDLASRFMSSVAAAGPEIPDTREVRRELIRRVIALDPAIDQAIGESSQLRLYSQRLQLAVHGLVGALAAWRAVACDLARSPEDWRVAQKLAAVFSYYRLASPVDWDQTPANLRKQIQGTVRALVTAQPSTPSHQLLADQTVKVLLGISQALRGIEFLMSAVTAPVSKENRLRLEVPDWLPPLVNAGRAFVAIGSAVLLWVISGWPNGTTCVIWTSITVVIFGPRPDRGNEDALRFLLGTCIAVVFAAVLKFSVLPQIETFTALSIALACYLIPVGALSSLGWQTAVFTPMAVNFVALLTPENAISYDTGEFYNSSLALLVGSGIAALAFRLMPPLSPSHRSRRLLSLTLRDLRRLADAPLPLRSEAWEQRIFSRISALPDSTLPLQRAQMVAALGVGTEAIRLNRLARRLCIDTGLEPTLEALARGNVALATASLTKLDRALEMTPIEGTSARLALHARASALALSEALAQHAAYFDTEAAE